MQIDPQILALRGNGKLHRQLADRMEEARQEWQARDDVRAIMQDLEHYGAGADFNRCPAIQSLMQDAENADRFIQSWIDHFTQILWQNPLAEIPFAQSGSPGLATMRIAQAGRANLALMTYQILPSDQAPILAPAAKSAPFHDREQYEIVIGGCAWGQMYRIENGNRQNAIGMGGNAAHIANGWPRITSRQFQWTMGDQIHLPDATGSRVIERVDGIFVLLHLSRTPPQPAPSKIYSLENGMLQRQISGCKLSSQRELAIALLGAMGRSDGAGAAEYWVQNGPAPLRWQALRQILALDARRGCTLLSAIAATPDDELQQPGMRLLETICRSYPQLAQTCLKHSNQGQVNNGPVSCVQGQVI